MTFGVNKNFLGGTVSDHGPKLSYTSAGKPQCSFTLVISDGDYQTFIPVMVVGPKAEACAERLEAGELVFLEGKISWHKGHEKGTGRLQVTCFDVQTLMPAAAVASSN